MSKKVVLGILLIIFTSCGSKSPGEKAGLQEGTDLCNSSFVSDYNKTKLKLNYASNVEDINSAESLVNDFGNKYKDLTCKAELSSSEKLNNAPTTISTNSKVAEWKGRISQTRQNLAERTTTTPSQLNQSTQPVQPTGSPGTAPSASNGNAIGKISIDLCRVKASGDIVMHNFKMQLTSAGIDRYADILKAYKACGATDTNIIFFYFYYRH